MPFVLVSWNDCLTFGQSYPNSILYATSPLLCAVTFVIYCMRCWLIVINNSESTLSKCSLKLACWCLYCLRNTFKDQCWWWTHRHVIKWFVKNVKRNVKAISLSRYSALSGTPQEKNGCCNYSYICASFKAYAGATFPSFTRSIIVNQK